MAIDACGRTEIEGEIGKYWVRSPNQSFNCRLGAWAPINTRRLRTHNIVEARHAAWDAQTLPDGIQPKNRLPLHCWEPVPKNNWERVTPAPLSQLGGSARSNASQRQLWLWRAQGR